MNQPDPVRARVLDALSLIASGDRLAAVNPELPPGRAAWLLCETWFDIVYQPGTRYMDGLKGDHDPESAEAFLAHFGEDERRWLERFNRFLELRVDRLTAGQRENRVFPPGERWTNVMRDAGHMVDLLGGNPRESRILETAAQNLLHA
ncbi:MAG: hypothetical protein JJ896_00675 [Rhodothermales bacterium]|nr:hypothetical protein [Rhodothermales bacterium]MBO6778141.1 hypothetical protein [Rhodothermales bacterium]